MAGQQVAGPPAFTSESERVMGAPDAPVTMVEFSDFQCSFCRKFWAETLPRLKETYIRTGQVRFVYQHFAVLGEPSVAAAQAVECAREQGKFWAYHDKLFESQGVGAFTGSKLKRYGRELGLDVAAFSRCLDSGKYRQKVENETQLGIELGARGTPTFFLNGRMLAGAQPFEVFHSAIEGALAEASRQPSGKARASNTGGGSFEHVHALAIDVEGRTLFLGAHTGLFRSEDGGRSWQKLTVSTKHSHLDVMAIAADPRDPRLIYIGTHEAGVFKSADGGITWSEANAGLGGLDVHGLAVDPTVPSKLHAAVREKDDGIYRTKDRGGKWTRVDDGPGGEVKVLASVNISTGMGGIYLYAGTAEGLQRSADCF
jgi:protein-disulfide isomerase